MTLLTRFLSLALAFVMTAGCAELPDLSEQARHREQVKVSTAHGWMGYEQSQALIRKLAPQAKKEDFLARHLQVEEAITGAPLTAGNALELYIDGPSAYKAMAQAIREATSYIHMESYIFDDDEIGNGFADLLIGKREEGVAVALMVDGVGTLMTPSTVFDRMRDAGVQVLVFNPVNPLEGRAPWALNERNHRKTLVVDGRVGFTGGINLSNVYSSRPSSGLRRGARDKEEKADDSDDEPWRDTHVRIEGPAVADLERVFLAGWQGQRGPELEAREFFPEQEQAGPSVVRIIANRPGEEDGHTLYLTLLSAFSSAERSIHITMAYFVPDPALIKSLQDAARRGVDVVLVLPGFTDSSIVFHAGRSHYQDLLEAGVRIFERNDALLHAKTAVVDRVWSTVGSSNMDWRSFTINHEVNAVIVGERFGGQMQKLFDDDVSLSHEVTLEDWKQRPFSNRFMEFFSRLGERWL